MAFWVSMSFSTQEILFKLVRESFIKKCEQTNKKFQLLNAESGRMCTLIGDRCEYGLLQKLVEG